MGIETALIATAVLSAASAVSGIQTANKAAKAKVQEGNLVLANKAKEIKAKASKAKVGFLNSGLTLEGGPTLAIDSIFDTGLEDINQIRTNYNTASKNIISEGRTKALEKLASAAGSFAMGSGMSMGGTSAGLDSFASGTGFGTGYDTYTSVNNPMNAGIF